MRFREVVLSLVMMSSLLTACGGGGGARSPDRLGSQLDPSTLRIDFPDFPSSTPVLAATGNNSISARMLGLQTDGVETNLGPELNVTGDTQWSLSGPIGSGTTADPILVELADAIRNAGSLGDVQDIFSAVRLASTESARTLVLKGTHTPSGSLLSANFILKPPVPVGAPYISGKSVFAFDPINSDASESTNYQLLQALQGVSTPENQTGTARFCSSNTAVISFADPQPPTIGMAPATVTNPFPAAGTSSVNVVVYTVDPQYACSDVNTIVNGVTVQPIASLVVQIIPAVVEQGGLSICAVINPSTNACDSSGAYVGDMSQCLGLDSNLVAVPAGERVQMVARISYTNPDDASQAPYVVNQCFLQERLSWSASPTTIFYDGLDEEGGFASLISQADFEAIADTEPSSNVTGSYDNNPASSTDAIITDVLNLKLVDAMVSAIEILPVDQSADTVDTLYLNLLQDGIKYRAECTYGTETPVVGACPDSCIAWSASDARLEANPSQNSAQTTVTAADGATGGTSELIASYTCSNAGVTDRREITLVDDDVVELHLLQVSNGNEPDVRSVDDFSCVGRTDLVGTLADGDTYIAGGQQFYVHALFESDEASWNDDPATLPDVSSAPAVVYTVTPGYANSDGSCSTLDNNGTLDLTDPMPVLSYGPVAAFSGEEKGNLQSTGLLRLSTVCIQAFGDANRNGIYDEGIDVLAQESSTVLVLPAADDQLLNFSNDLCEILEPVLTLGSGIPGIDAGVVVPLIYGLSLVTDPILSTLTTTEYGGLIPADELINALITGQFSALSVGDLQFEDAPFGLGAITGGLLGGIAEVPGLEALVDVLDACLLDPVLSTVEALLQTLLSFDVSGFEDLGNLDYAQCTDLFGGIAP